MINYKVKALDNLTKIAKKYNVTVNEIVQANKELIKDPNKIKVGWVLNIPTQEDTKPEPAPETTPNPPYKKIGRKALAIIEKIEAMPEYKELMELMK